MRQGKSKPRLKVGRRSVRVWVVLGHAGILPQRPCFIMASSRMNLVRALDVRRMVDGATVARGPDDRHDVSRRDVVALTERFRLLLGQRQAIELGNLFPAEPVGIASRHAEDVASDGGLPQV